MKKSTLNIGPKARNVEVTAKCADCDQIAPLYDNSKRTGLCKECAEKDEETRKRLEAELDHINEMREKSQKKGEESLTEFIKEKCEEMKEEKKNIVVDLDGTLAYYDEWKGLDHIGGPLPGAKEFVEALKVKYNVIIFTCRTSTTVNLVEPDMKLPLVAKIVDWLSKYNFPQVEVWAGDGKPIGEYYVDDRGLACVPQEDPDAYWKILSVVQ